MTNRRFLWWGAVGLMGISSLNGFINEAADAIPGYLLAILLLMIADREHWQ